MPGGDLSYSAGHLQRFVRYVMSRVIRPERWWTVFDLNFYWEKDARYPPITWTEESVEVEVRCINNTGRKWLRIERRHVPGASPEYRQTDEDRQRNPYKDLNQNRKASRCIVQFLNHNDNQGEWIIIDEVLAHLALEMPGSNFQENYIKLNCVNWAAGRLEMVVDPPSGKAWLRSVCPEDRPHVVRPPHLDLAPLPGPSAPIADIVTAPLPGQDGTLPIAIEDDF